jgi:glycosyltransferase involved in cell wall biosynthesis
VPELADREITIHPYPVDWRFVERSRAGAPRTNEVLYVGRMEERKGVQSLVQAASTFLRACPDATLRMVGGDTPLSGLPAIPFFDARDAGIVVVSGSGNSGPAPGVGFPCTGITVLPQQPPLLALTLKVLALLP